MIATIRDMSHWLEVENLKTSTKSKTVAFAQAAHEFRNPLNGMILSLELIEDYVSADEEA